MAIIDWALRYASMGWAVLPLKPRDKVPHGMLVPRGLLDASKDAAVIRSWWAQCPDANIGIATGAASGFNALDVDPRHDGDVTLFTLREELGLPEPDTPTNLTGGGGYQYLFHSNGLLRNSAGLLGPGIDVRGDGGYICVPPSIHPNGKAYEWEGSSDPLDGFQMAGHEYMSALIATIKQPSSNRQANGEDCQVTEGGRNQHLTGFAGMLRRNGIGVKGMYAALMAENAERCSPPLPDAEVMTISKSVHRYEPEKQTKIQDEWIETPKAAFLSELTHEEIDWILPGYIGVGLITLVQGPIGARKTTLLLGWAQALTQGHGYHLPEVTHRKRGVLFITLEAGVNYKQLLSHAGGNHELFRCFGCIDMHNGDERFTRPVNLWNDQKHLLDQCSQIPDLGCIIVDPIGSHVGNKNDSMQIHKCYSVLEDLMDRFKCACVVTSHLNKDPFKSADARANGANELVTRARCFFTAGRDKDDKHLSHLVPVRTSFYDESKLGFAYRNSPNNIGAEWSIEKYEGNADDILRRDDPGEGGIREWLGKQLLLGYPVLVSRIRTEAEAAGFNWRSVSTIKDKTKNIRAIAQDADIKGKVKKCWYWEKV